MGNWTLEKISKKLHEMYSAGHLMERPVVITKCEGYWDGYEGYVAYVLFALKGSPPKAFAVCQPERRFIIFFDIDGKNKVRYDDAELDIEGLPGFVSPT